MSLYSHLPLWQVLKKNRDGRQKNGKTDWQNVEKETEYLFLWESQVSSLSTTGARNLRKFGTEEEECNLALKPLSPDGLRDRAWERERERPQGKGVRHRESLKPEQKRTLACTCWSRIKNTLGWFHICALCVGKTLWFIHIIINTYYNIKYFCNNAEHFLLLLTTTQNCVREVK